MLQPALSQELRETLLSEIASLKDGNDLALWAHRRLPSRNTLTEDDARAVEAAYKALLDVHVDFKPELASTTASVEAPTYKPPIEAIDTPAGTEPAVDSTVTPLTKPVRQRSKAHLIFVAAQPCLICKRSPCDAHHLKFAGPRALGRKVTVPLCRAHHQELHRHGNEAGWWANIQIAPMPIAKQLWQSSPIHGATIEIKASTDIEDASRKNLGKVR